MTVASPGIRTQVDDVDLAPEAEIGPQVSRDVLQRVVPEVKALELEALDGHFVEGLRVDEAVVGVVVENEGRQVGQRTERPGFDSLQAHEVARAQGLHVGHAQEGIPAEVSHQVAVDVELDQSLGVLGLSGDDDELVVREVELDQTLQPCEEVFRQV